MSTNAWRRFLLSLCVVALITFGANAWTGLNDTAIIEIGGSATSIPFLQTLSVPGTSLAHRAGLRTGDIVDLRQLSIGDRFRWYVGWWWPGERLAISSMRDNTIRHVSLVAQRYRLNWD